MEHPKIGILQPGELEGERGFSEYWVEDRG